MTSASTVPGFLTAANFKSVYSVQAQTKLAALPEDRAYFGIAPTLTAVSKEFGEEVALEWLVYQLGNLSEFCGVREKLTGMQIRELAMLIMPKYHYLKVSELMLFFMKFKCGHYGQLYGAVDPQRIMMALSEFRIERGIAYDKRQHRINAEQREEAEKNYTPRYLYNLKRNAKISRAGYKGPISQDLAIAVNKALNRYRPVKICLKQIQKKYQSS